MNFYFKILLILIFDFLVFWTWFWYEDPDPSVSIALVLIVPVVIVTNLILAGIFKLLKNKKWTKIFLLNSILASIIAYFLWTKAIERHQSKIWETWTFSYKSKDYQIDLYKPDKTVDLIYRPKNRPSTDLIFSGKATYEENKIFIINDSIKFVIENDSLSGFMNDKIKLEKN